MSRTFRIDRSGFAWLVQSSSTAGDKVLAFVAPDTDGAPATANKVSAKKLRPKFGDTVEAFASSARRAGFRTCRVPSLITHW